MATPRAGKEKNEERIDAPTRIVQLVMDAGARLFHTATPEAFATIPVKCHLETWRIRDTHFRRWISGLYYAKQGTTPSDLNISAALNVLDAKAVYDGSEKPVCVRVAGHENHIYLDLANDRWETVEITPSGWSVLSHSPVKFRRTGGMLALPTPIRGGSIAELRPFVNVGDDDHFLLILAWLIAAFRPVGPYPVLVLEGNQGSAKSTTGKLLRSLIDPNIALLRSTPRNERDLMISADNSWCQAFENLSEVPPWLSDCLCRLSTGGGFSTRRNYTDDEEKLFNAMRPVMLNGISVGLERADLLDRSLVIQLGEITEEKRLPEALFWAQFERARPRILGALLDVISDALRRLPQIVITRSPRMVDFARWATAAEPALGLAEGAFLTAYRINRHDANELALESSVILPALKVVAEHGPWSGTSSELLDFMLGLTGVDSRQAGWPRTAAQLSGQLRRLRPGLGSTGIVVRTQKTAGTNSKKIITLSKASGGQSLGTETEDVSTASLASHSSPIRSF